MERIEEIRARVERLKTPHRVKIDVSGSVDISGIAAVYANSPSMIVALLAEVDRQSAQLARIKAALLLAGCSDFSEDVAEMAEEFLAQPEEG